MDNSLKASIEALIRAKRGFEFEALISEIHLIQYGSDGFQPTRERKDDGAEGIILSSKTVIAAYGPDAYDEKRFLKKVNDDFDDFLNKWAAENPNWKMHYNGSLAPEQIRISETLKSKAASKQITVNIILVKGVDQIMQLVEEEFSNKQQRQLATYLGVAKELIIFDHIRSIIDDLIRGIEIDPENIRYDLKIDIEEKINLNYTPEDAILASEEYQDFVVNGTLKKIWGILSTYENEEINSLKMRIKREFNNLTGTFKDKLNRLTESYLNKYSSGQDDDFEYFTRALLVYSFEQCMIGDKIKSEEKQAP
ncbi:hypothetical protein GO495_27310 [Chitinophaga oryziterrae]|uniref:Uncharacterized protein n=1 Tax=Chitinophaga oryziterrae TaxID=1031224 RepID=A0A6N8JGG4_9BACT|nr:hypothetical protein [Chitinophaga oryziterrae]MVT44333.1 hypothetical protein [Chitinophaga oryziterrae]